METLVEVQDMCKIYNPGDKDINEARRVIAASEPIAHYAPQDGEVWEEAYKTYLKVTGQEA